MPADDVNTAATAVNIVDDVISALSKVARHIDDVVTVAAVFRATDDLERLKALLEEDTCMTRKGSVRAEFLFQLIEFLSRVLLLLADRFARG